MANQQNIKNPFELIGKPVGDALTNLKKSNPIVANSQAKKPVSNDALSSATFAFTAPAIKFARKTRNDWLNKTMPELVEVNNEIARVENDLANSEKTYTDAYWQNRYDEEAARIAREGEEFFQTHGYHNTTNVASAHGKVDSEKQKVEDERVNMRKSIMDLNSMKKIYEGMSVLHEPDYEKYAEIGANRVDNDVLINRPVDGEIVRSPYYDGIAYELMEDAEVGAYNYILGKYGKDAANDFLSGLDLVLTARQGKRTADNLAGIKVPVLKQLAYGAYGLASGIDGSIQGIGEFFSDDPHKTTASEYASQYILEDLADKGIKFGDTSSAQLLYKGTQTVGNVLPSMAVSYLTHGIGTAAGLSPKTASKIASFAGNAEIGLSAAGSAYSRALAEGYDKGSARTYSVLVGASETVLSQLLSGYTHLGGVSTNKILAKISAADNAFARVIGTGVVKSVSEIFEEELQLFLEPLFRNIVFNEEYDAPEVGEIVETALVTALSTGALNGDVVKIIETVPKRVGINKDVNALVNLLKISANKNTTQTDGGYERYYDVNKVSTDFVESVDNDLKAYVDSIETDADSAVDSFDMGKSSDRLNNDIRALTGIDTSSYSHRIRKNTIKHIFKRHGKKGQHDRSMANNDDIARIGYVLNNYDSIELLNDVSNEYRDKNQRPAPLIKLSKRVDGTVYVAEAVPDTRAKKLAVVSAYIEKPSQQTRDVQAPLSDVQNASTDDGSIDKLSQINGTVKENDSPNSDMVGVVRDEYTATLDEALVNELDEMARRLGLRVEFTDGISSNKNADASIKGNVVKINKNTKQPVLQLVGHEITHHLQRVSPEAYAKFERLALKRIGDKSVIDTYLRYKSAGVKEVDTKMAIEEAVADYAGTLVYDKKVLDKFISDNKRDKGILGTVRSAVTYLKDRLIGKSKVQAQVAEAKLTNAINDVNLENENTAQTDGERYSIKEIIGDSGKNYGIGVYLDSTLLDGLTDTEKKQMVKLRVVEELAGGDFVAYDNNNNAVDIKIAKKGAKFKNKNGNKRRVVEELYRKNIGLPIKQETIVLADELIEAAKYDKSTPARHPHDWLDNYGNNNWDDWKVIVQDKNNTVWEATLKIANSANGEKILYDIDPIKMVEQAGKTATSTTKYSISNSDENVNNNLSPNFVNEDDVERFVISGPSYDELIAKPPVAIIDIGNNEAGLSYKDLKVRAISKALNEGWFERPHHNNDTGFDVFVSKDAYTHAFSNLTSSFGEDTILAMEHVPEIIETAVLAKVDNPRNTRRAENKVYTFFGAVRGAKGVEPVKITVKEYDSDTIGTMPENVKNYFDKNKKQPEYHRLYDAKVLEVVSIEKEPSASASVAVPEGAGAKGTLDSNISVADLLDLVNGDARKYIPERFSIKRPDTDTDTPNADIAELLDMLDTEEASEATKLRLEELREKYGVIPKGEKPFRDVQVPKKTAEDKYVSQTVRTILEAQATPDEMLPTIEKLIAEGEFSYDRYTDDAARADANATIKNTGWHNAYADWKYESEKGSISKKNTAIGWALYNDAVKSGNMETAIDILSTIADNQRSAAQALQATRILKKLSPESQLYQAQRKIARLQEELNDKYRKKGAPELKINEDLAAEFLKAKTQERRDEVLKEIYLDIGRQMPSTFGDKWRAWRYTAMLFNTTTHERNFLGNFFFAPVVMAKNALATSIESAVYHLSGGKLNRTKAFGKGYRKLKDAAKGDYKNVADVISGGGKYTDGQNMNQYIREGQVIFKSDKPVLKQAAKIPEALRVWNSKAMEAEDTWFSKPHYATALAQYCKANGITEAEVRAGKIPDAAREYAIKEAQKATYRDTNILSHFLSKRARETGEYKWAAKTVNVLYDGVLPFRKTPANILVRALEYGPAGLTKTIIKGTWDVARGNITGAQFIDNLSAGLTGTGLMGLGIYLATQGLIRGHGSEDEKEREFEELMGHQAYSLELPNGMSVTLDWLAPEALPFFMGVNFWEMTQNADEGITLERILSIFKTTTEPMLEMSCLQSLDSFFSSLGYASNNGMNPLSTLITTALSSFLTQAVPTISGKVERMGEGERYTTFTVKNPLLTSDIQRTLSKVSAKIPMWDFQQVPYVDAWGRREKTGDLAQRAFTNLLNPAYTSQIDESEMEKELMRVYRATGEGSVFPSRAPKYFTIDGESKYLTGDEYVEYATKKGQTSYELITSITESSEYESLGEAEKVDAIGFAYDYSNQIAKEDISAFKPEKWVSNMEIAKEKYGIPERTFILLKVRTGDVESIKKKKENGELETIDNSKGLQIMEIIYDFPGLEDAQRKVLFEYFGVGKKIRDYTKEEVNEALSEMRKKGVN